ncbi:MAG: helix-turn-helix domain-containing protein [Cyanobium sp.]
MVKADMQMPQPVSDLAPVMLDDDDDHAQAPVAAAAPKPTRRRLRPVPAGVVPDGWISVEGLADRVHLTRGAVQRWAREGLIPENQMIHWRGRWWFDPAVEPPKPQPRTPRPAPDGWVHGAAVCSLLGIDRAQLARWRREGVIPAGTYQPHGRGYVFDGDVVEAMLKRLQPAAMGRQAGDSDEWVD